MSKVKSLDKMERGVSVVITLTDGKTVKGTVQRVAKRGGTIAAVYVNDGGSKAARVGVAKIKSVDIKGKAKDAVPKKKVAKKEKPAKGKTSRKAKTAQKEKPSKKGPSKTDLKAARAELKTATSGAKLATTALKKAATAFIRAQGIKGDDKKDMMDGINESIANIKSAIGNLKASDLKPEE